MALTGRQAAKKKFMDFLGSKNLRLTSQRQAIIDTVFNTNKHFTAEQLLEWSREKDKSVSRATVYRTLPLLTASGLVREMDFGDRKSTRLNSSHSQISYAVFCLKKKKKKKKNKKKRKIK